MTEYIRLARNYNFKLIRLMPFSRQIIVATGADLADPASATPKDLTGYTVVESGIYSSGTSPLSANKMGEFVVTITDPVNGVITVEMDKTHIENLAFQINDKIQDRPLQKNFEFANCKIRLADSGGNVTDKIDGIVSMDV